MSRLSPLLFALLVAFGSTACGGGGGGGGSADPGTPTAVSPIPTGVDLSAVDRADPGSTLDSAWVNGAFMQIFVRSYQDSDGDGIGDLKGLISRLDYLQALGVRGLWLLPVNRSQDRDHGYAVSNYRDIEADYGSLADFDELLKQAHRRGIGVVIDYVINHSASDHPLFVAAKQDAASAYRNWYIWQNTAPTGWNVFGNNPWRLIGTGYYYAPFSERMPDWNLREAKVVDFHRHNLRFWLNRGVDGFRFDAVGMLFENGSGAWENQPQNLTLMDDIALELGAYNRRFMICEAPSASVAFADACGRAFAFGLQSTLLRAANGDTAAVTALAAANTDPALSPFLSNHDGFAGARPYNQLNGDLRALKLAAALNLLRPGTPFIYYGEEIGMAGDPANGGDPAIRNPMSWTADAATAGFTSGRPYRPLASNSTTQNVAAQDSDAASLLNHYRRLLALRNAQPAIARGTLENARADGATLSYWRRQGSDALLVIVHTARSARTGFTLAGLPANARLQRLFGTGGEVVANAQGELALDLPAQSVHVFKLP